MGQFKVKIEELAEKHLRQHSLNKTKEANFELLLRDARQEAAKNGLTEEILDKLLNEEN